MMFLLLIVMINSSWSSKWTISNSTSYTTTQVQFKFTGYTFTQVFRVVSGPIENSLYYLYLINSPGNYLGIRKYSSSETYVWDAVISQRPVNKFLEVDPIEQSVYAATYSVPTIIFKLIAKTGVLETMQQHYVNWNTFDMKLHILSDNSGYFLIGKDNASTTSKICKYIYLAIRQIVDS